MSNMLLTGRKVLVPVMTAGSKLLISASIPMTSVPPFFGAPAELAAGEELLLLDELDELLVDWLDVVVDFDDEPPQAASSDGMLSAPATTAVPLSNWRRETPRCRLFGKKWVIGSLPLQGVVR